MLLKPSEPVHNTHQLRINFRNDILCNIVAHIITRDVVNPRQLVDDQSLIAEEKPGDILDQVQPGRDAENVYEQGWQNLASL